MHALHFMVFLCCLVLAIAMTHCADAEGVTYAGDPAWYMPDLARSREKTAAEVAIPRSPVTRKDYVDFCRPQAAQFYSGPDRGPYGPRHALPALAVFAYDGDKKLGEGIKQTLRHYANWVNGQVEKMQGVFSLEGPTLCALYFRELRKQGLMTPQDEVWARELMLNFQRYHFAWRPKDGLWRGQHHRSQTQGIAHALAAAFYPGEPDAAKWQAYADQVWNDWWAFRDVGINDTSYYFSSLNNVLLAAELLGRKEVFTDPEAQDLIWKRMLYEVTPDGAAPPYGSHGGYNCHAGHRIFALELAAKYTRDGRYRWVAHRLMNYAQARGGFSPGHHHIKATSEEHVALASLFCDDSVNPVAPDDGSQLLMRKEVLRLTNAQCREMFPDAGGVDCNMYMSNRSLPSKLAFRSGWEPGDLFMLVECFTRHDPLNPTAILSLERHASAFALPTSEKFVSRENAVKIDDLSGEATFCGKRGKERPRMLTLGYESMQATVPDFSDHRAATHARVHVTNYMGYNAEHDREFLFVKNRFVLVRDETQFAEAFKARVGPTWNTQNIGAAGDNWVDTWFSDHYFQRALLYHNPAWNLLVYHAPKPDRQLTVTGRWEESTIDVPYSTQYAWEGPVQPGDRVQFVQLYLPHAPEEKADQQARRIAVLRDEPGLAVVSIKTGDNGGEYAVLNRAGAPVTVTTDGPVTDLATDARALYLIFDRKPGNPEEKDPLAGAAGTAGEHVRALLVIDGTFVTVNGEAVFRGEQRTTFEKPTAGYGLE